MQAAESLTERHPLGPLDPTGRASGPKEGQFFMQGKNTRKVQVETEEEHEVEGRKLNCLDGRLPFWLKLKSR